MDGGSNSYERKTGPTYGLVGEDFRLRDSKTAPAHKTGLSGVRPEPQSSDFSTEFISLYQKALGTAADAWARHTSEKGETELSKAVQDALLEFAKAEVTSTAEKLPFGKILTSAVNLSWAFADGVGGKLQAVNAELQRSYDDDLARATSGGEVTPEQAAAMRRLEGWQARSTERLESILREGLAAVAEKVIHDLFKLASAQIAKSLTSVVSQVSKELFKNGAFASIVNDAALLAAQDIPSARAKLERITFQTLASAWVGQFTSKSFQARAKPILTQIKSEHPLHVALLAGILEVLARGGYDAYAKKVQVERAWSDLESLLVQAARRLIVEAKQSGATISTGDELVVYPSAVVVPDKLATVMIPPGPTTQEQRDYYWQRYFEFHAAIDRFKQAFQAVRQSYEKRARRVWRHEGEARAEAVAQSLETRLREVSEATIREIFEMQRKAIQEFRGVIDDSDPTSFFLEPTRMREEVFNAVISKPWRK